MSPIEQKMMLSSLRHSYNTVASKIEEGQYYPAEPDSHNEEALNSLLRTRAIYAKLIQEYSLPKD